MTQLRIIAKDYNFKRVLSVARREKERVDRATVKAIDRFGAIVRQDARKAIGSPVRKTRPVGEVWFEGRNRTIWSKPTPPRAPGKPPRARTNDQFNSLKNIRYIPFYRRGFVRIGVWETGVSYRGGKSGAELHEFGMTYTTRVLYVPTELTMENTMSRKGKRRVKSQSVTLLEWAKYGKPMTFRMPKRPIMRPPFEKHKNRMTQIWIDYYKASRGR